MTEPKTDFPTIIGADAIFKGHLQFEKGVRLLGKFEGEIASEGELVIAEGATLNGDVKAGTVRIDGQVKGNLEAKAKVHLTSSARLEGDVQAARLEVAEGAVLIGRCVVGVNGHGHGKAGEVAKSASAPAAAVPATTQKSGERQTSQTGAAAGRK